MSEMAEKVRNIVDSGSFEQLIGLTEAPDVEFKSMHYSTSTEGMFELAKDLAAMANSGPGMLIIGVSTFTSVSLRSDVVDGFRLQDLGKTKVVQRYREIIGRMIFPILDVTITPKPYRGHPQSGLFVLEITNEQSVRRPFAVIKTPCGTEKKTGREN